MANSKSNIYPIQLQGAELNLNKLDAEIKQYSGFNKNNAPFVGGCLSNVFSRTQSVEGADDDNTIIDENGDVYTVDTEGLKKNGKQVSYFSNKVFFEQEEIVNNTQFEVVRYFSDKIKVVRTYEGTSDDKFVRFYLLLEGETSLSSNRVILSYQASGSRTAINNKYSLDKFMTCIFISKGEKQYAIVVAITDSGSIKLFSIDCDLLQVVGTSVYSYSYQTYGAVHIDVDHGCPLAVTYDETASQIAVYNRFEKSSDGSIICNLIFWTIGNGGTISRISGSVTSDIWGTQSGLLNVGEGLVNTKISGYSCFNYPYNFLIVREYTGLQEKRGSTSSDTDKVKFINKLKSPYFEDSVVKFRDKELINYPDINLINNYVSGTFSPDTYVEVDSKEDIDNGIFTPLIGCYDYQLAVTENYGDTTKKSLYVHNAGNEYCYNGFQFYQKYIYFSGQTISKAKFVLGDAVSLGSNFLLLFNNNNLSAISGNNTLLTDWNKVDVNSICYYSDTRGENIDERVFYKTVDDKWFVIKLGNPKIKKVYNQIVANADDVRNSYDVTRNKILHFGINYNSVYSGIGYHSKNNFYDLYNESNNAYIAAAVNEYNQEDNSSIILNPILLKDDGPAVGVKFEDLVNIYYGTLEDSQILYRFSASKLRWGGSTIYDKDLIGLPFPSDTNGNVEYSPNIFSEVTQYGTDAFIKSGDTAYPLVMGNNNEPIMSFYMASGIENLKTVFIIQGQYYGTIGNKLFSMQFANGVVTNVSFIVDIIGLEFVGNTPYEALFFSKTNRCLYSFTGANILSQKQLVDKISEVRDYLYNPATQTVFLITDIGVLFYGIFGQFLLEYTDVSKIFLLQNGIVMSNNSGNYRYIKYYLDEGDTDFEKHNINLETCFYGMNNQTVTINDCLYFRLFSEEHEEGSLKVSATTISLRGRKTEETTFKIRASDWDKITHTIYLRYQPKEQRGLGISFSINSPFKIASLSVGSQADAILVDKVSKGAINAPQRTSNNVEW